MSLLPWRKMQAGLSGNDQQAMVSAVDHITDIGGDTNIRQINAADDRPVLTLVQSGTGYNLLCEAGTPEIRITETDQTDPLGRYRFKIASDIFYFQKALTAAWATSLDILKVDANSNAITLSSNGDTDWSLVLEAGTVAADKAKISLITDFGIQMQTGTGAAAATRLTIGEGAAVSPITIGGAYFKWSGTDFRDIEYRAITSDAVVRALDLVYNRSNGAGTNGIGTGLGFRVETTTTERTLAGSIECLWTNATHASRVADMVFYIEDDFDDVLEEYFRLDGSAKTILLNNALDCNNKAVDNILQLNLTDPTELTIASGAITVTQGFHSVDTESDASTDNLDTINGGTTGDELIIIPAHTDRTVVIRNGVGNIYLASHNVTKSFSFNSPAGSTGRYYAAGFYRAPVTDANLTQASTTVSYGTANIAYGAHAFLVAAAAGATDTGTVSIVVSGTSIDDEGTRTASDTETIVADVTSMSTNAYYETTSKWIGTIVYTLTPAGGATTYNADFNYGLCKYEDISNRHFHLTDFECVGRAGANDTGFNIRLLHHSSTGWTYHASAFVPGGTELANMNTSYNTEINLSNGQPFAFKLNNLSTEIDGDASEGVVVEVTTGANKAVDRMSIHIGLHAVPKFYNLDSTEESVKFIYNGTNWLEI